MEIPNSKYKIDHTIEKAIEGGMSSGFFRFLYHSPSAVYNKDMENPKTKGANTNKIFNIFMQFVLLSTLL